MKPLSRALAGLVSVCTLFGLGVAAAPAAVAGACDGVVSTSGLAGFGVVVETGAATICFDVAGVRRVIGVQAVNEVVYVEDAFRCGNPVGGTIGDPNDPPFVEYRVGVDSDGAGGVTDVRDWLIVCVGVGASSKTVGFVTTGRPEVVLYTPGPGGGTSCGAGGPEQEVEVALSPFGGPDQSVNVGAGGAGSPLVSDYYCVGARGLVECSLFAPSGSLLAQPYLCPPAAALVAEVGARVAEAVALAEEAVGTVTETVDAVVAEVRQVVDPVVAMVLAEVMNALDEAEELLPVEIASSMGACSVSVTSLTSPQVEVRRSPTGQVPASVCVVTAAGVTRVTVG